MQPQLSAADSMTVFVYHGRTGVRPSQFASLFNPGGIVQVYASTAPAQCNLQGPSIAIGSGLTGSRNDTFIHLPTGAAYAAGGSVSFLTGGLNVSLWLSANDAASEDQYWATFGPAWQHILASFVPGPAIPDGHPCG